MCKRGCRGHRDPKTPGGMSKAVIGCRRGDKVCVIAAFGHVIRMGRKLAATGYDAKHFAKTFPFAARHAIGFTEGL